MIKDYSRIIVRIKLAALIAVAIALLATTTGTAFPLSASSEQEPSPTSTNCYQAGFEGQTHDPGNVLQPGSTHSTTWLVVNRGSCVWTPDYSWTFLGGAKMGAPDTVYINEEVHPGESIYITLHLTAPQTEGVHTGHWVLQDPGGILFGVSENATSAFFISILVSLDPGASYPLASGDIPRMYLDINPNLTEVPPTETVTPTEPAATATLTRTPSPTETSTPAPAASIAVPVDPGLSDHPLFTFDDQYFNISYRDSSPFVPEFSTRIPSPLDVSLDPAVIGTNVLLAALLMIPFAYANESLGRMIEESNKNRSAKRRASKWLRKLQEWFDRSLTVNSKGRIVLRDKMRVLILILFFGLVFSLLDNTWNPLSGEGVMLFISMTIAFGIIGMADDFIQWRRIRKWNLPAHLRLNPSNLLLAISSTFISRFLFLMPGLMFGTPELLQVNEEIISQKRQKQLLRISMITLTIIGLAAWIPTLITS